MSGLKVMLFGIAVILFSGFIVVGQAAGYAYDSLLFWGMILGLAITFVGLMIDDSGERDENFQSDRDDGNDSGRPREKGEENDEDGENDEAVENDRRYVPISRFPPM